MRYFGTALTDTGISKNINQDSLCLKIAQTDDCGQAVMAVVCDGMGGLAKGELASATVIRAFENWFHNVLPKQIADHTAEQFAPGLVHLVKEQNYRIMNYGKQVGASLGTTVTVLLIIRDAYVILHVGDTRVYEIEDETRQLTEDQTYVAREVRCGRMTPEEALTHKRRNMLLQCVGASEVVTPDILSGRVCPGAVYMLCSDGFRHAISEQEIGSSLHPDNLRDVESMEKNGRYLIDLIKERREKDNISVMLLRGIA
ncbi:MAG: protein phosphatase 2C domain-containing protein [Clostridiales bacterium]|nr:protein phosphatase 2C domain-containing protein [Clostridiales bacterium]